jgi:hypothetical protein
LAQARKLPENVTDPMRTESTMVSETVNVGAMHAGFQVAQELGARHQRRGAAAERVEHGHHLGHGRHLDPAGQEHADGGADHEAEDDPDPAQDPAEEEGGDDGQQHPGRAQHVAAARGLGGAESLEPQDEEDRRDQIRDMHEDLHQSSDLFGHVMPPVLPSS